MQSKPGRLLKGIGWALLSLFILFNLITFFHAYKFTHFTTHHPARFDEGARHSKLATLTTILFGVDSERPQDKSTPTQPYQNITINSNVPLAAWLIKTDSAKGTVVIFHGYRGERSSMIDRSDEFLKLGYNTMLVDFMGSGASGGNSTTIGVEEAREVKDCYDYVAGTGEKNIILFGTSMGAVSIMKAVSNYHIQPKALFLECPFGTMYKTVCARFRLMGLQPVPGAALLMFWGGLQNGFWAFGHNPVEYAKAITMPTLLLYGEKDNRVSAEETAEIFKNMKGPKQLVTYPESGHEDYLNKYHDKWLADVNSFLLSI